MFGPLRERQQPFDRRQEIIGDGAADAAIGELDDALLLVARGVAAGLQDVAIDADVAELIDDQREAAAAGVGEKMTDQRRLPRAEEAGDDGRRNLGETGHADSAMAAPGPLALVSPGRFSWSAARMRAPSPADRPPASIKAGAPRRPFARFERQVSWLAGHRLARPSQNPVARSPSGLVARGSPLTVAGAAAASGAKPRRRIPFYPSKRGTVAKAGQ